jgi:hypothetical protein
MKSIKLSLTLIALISIGSISQAFEGTRGGGDSCENRIQVIRDDIASWIRSGGPKDLNLPTGVSSKGYSESMLQEVATAQIRCIGKGDKAYPVQVYGTPKICAFDKSFLGKARVTCDREAFLKLEEGQQYVLVHHEYAGLAGIEQPQKDDSVYGVSNQLSEYLVDQVVKRLAIKNTLPQKPRPNTEWQRLAGAEAEKTAVGLQLALANTEFLDCKVDVSNYKEACSVVSYEKNNSPNQNVSISTGCNIGDFDPVNTTRGSYTFSKSTRGPLRFQDLTHGVLRDHSVSYDERDIVFDVIYYMNESQSALTKVSFREFKRLLVNVGTISNPKVGYKLVPAGRQNFDCHAK